MIRARFISSILFLFIAPFYSLELTEFNQKTDYPCVVKLIKTEWSKLFYMPQFNPTLVENMFLKKIPGNAVYKTKPLFIKIARENNNFIGFVTYYYANPAIGYIELFAISPEFRGKGFGKQIIDAIAAEMAAHHIKELYLYVYTTNPKAIEFYYHLGFTLKEKHTSHLLLGLKLCNLHEPK